MYKLTNASLMLLALPRVAVATWPNIAIDIRTGQVIIGSTTCVRQMSFQQRQPNGARDLMDIQAVIVPGTGVAACQAGVGNSRENQMLVYDELRKGTSPAKILEMLKHDPNIERRQFGILALPNGSTIARQHHMAGFNGANNSTSSRYDARNRAASNRTAPPGPTHYRPTQVSGPNPVNLWLVDLKWTGSQLSAGAPVKLTSDNGTNSQPSFSPDGRSVVFSATRDSGSSEIYRIDLATRTETRITRTRENENSPTVNSAGEYVAVRWVPATLFREFGVWMYSADGTPARGVLRGPDTTGYYTPLGSGDYALTRPKATTFTIALFDDQSGVITDVDSGVPALPAQLIPGQRALSYVRIDSADGKHTLRRVDLATKRTSSIGPTVVGRTVHAWIPRHNTILMAKGNVLYARRGSESVWHVVARFDDPDLRNASAYAVSPDGDKLVLTSPKRLTFGVVLRDSLEAGHSGQAVAAMAARMSEAGQLANIDVSENAISALADDQLQKKRFADAVALHTMATTFFPRSYRAQGRLGDAQRAAGDNTAALASYRRALDLNPRLTDADRAEAAAIERKISGQPSGLSVRGTTNFTGSSVPVRVATPQGVTLSTACAVDEGGAV